MPINIWTSDSWRVHPVPMYDRLTSCILPFPSTDYLLLQQQHLWANKASPSAFMKFPLPADTFPSLFLSQHDEEALKSLAEAFVGDAMVEYRAFRSPPHNGTIDDTCYKLLKKKDELTSYLDRKFLAREAQDVSGLRQSLQESVGSMKFSKRLLGILTVGTISGSLHDQMYGIHHYSTELMRIKSAYLADTIADGRVLCEVCTPTPEHPMNGLYIKWSVSIVGPPLLCRVVRPRDFVYMEGTGIVEDDITGEKIGFALLHSLEIPSIPELTKYQIVRAQFSICALFRQKASGVVEVYMKGFVDSKGDIHKSVAVPATVEALMSFRKGTYCGQMKKLNWLVKTKRAVMVDQPSGMCFVCQKKVGKLLSWSHLCQICMNQVCSVCSEIRMLAFLSPSRRILRRQTTFCARCMRVAQLADGLTIASEELRQLNPLEYFELSSSDSNLCLSPSRSTLPDTNQEFFGAA